MVDLFLSRQISGKEIENAKKQEYTKVQKAKW